MDTSARPPLPDLSRFAPWAGPALIAATALIVLNWSWGHWPDVLIDFGRELYIPWRLSEGDILYRDISYFNGPLSPYLNTLWFEVFGVGLRTLAIANITIVAILATLLYRILVRISGRFAASIACLVFVSLFAFAQLDTIGNYNYVSPYSHETTHGLLLCFAAITALSAYPKRGALALSTAGFSLGLIALTKTEMLLAGSAALGTGLILSFWAHRIPTTTALRALAIFGGAALLPPLVALAALSSQMPFETALSGLLDPFASTFNPAVTSLNFYRWGMGTLFLDESLAKITRWTLMYAGLFVPAAGLAFALKKPGTHRWWLTAVVAGLILIYMRLDRIELWTHSVRPLPLLLVVAGIAGFLRLRSDMREDRDPSDSVLRLSFAVFALALLAKIILNVRLMHYGFALAMPASMLGIVALVSWVPRWIESRGGFGPVFAAAALAALLVIEVSLLNVMAGRFERRMTPVASGSDAFLAGQRAPLVKMALADLAGRTSSEDTVAVLPEGIMLNYLARRASPISYTNFMPPELLIYGEEQILDEFRANPPDFVLIVHKFTGEYGFPFFGQDYGKTLYFWVTQHYREVKLYGRPPLVRLPDFGIRVLERIGRRQPGKRVSGEQPS